MLNFSKSVRHVKKKSLFQLKKKKKMKKKMKKKKNHADIKSAVMDTKKREKK